MKVINLIITIMISFIAWMIGYMGGLSKATNDYSKVVNMCIGTIDECSNLLNDPHHCVSVCQEEFEKWGC